MKGRCRVDVQQLEEAWAARVGARGARLVMARMCRRRCLSWGLCAPVTAWWPLRTTLPMRLRAALMAAMLCWWGIRAPRRLPPHPRALMLRLMPSCRTQWWFVNSIGGFGLRVPDLRALGRAARDARALLVVDNTVAGVFGCDPLRLGAVLSLEALDRVCAGKAPRKLVAASVARSQLKRHRVDAAAECAYALLEGCGLAKLNLPADEAGVLERVLELLHTRMQAHFDRARALAEYLAANEMVRDVRYPGLSSHPDHAVATGILEHGSSLQLNLTLSSVARRAVRRFAGGVSHIACRRRNDAPFGFTRQAGEHHPPLRRHRQPR